MSHLIAGLLLAARPDHNLWWQMRHYTGTGNGGGFWYLLWSGILGSCAIGAAVWIRHRNCHVKGCWRYRSYDVPGTGFRACRHHHPHVDGARHVTAEIIAEAYRKATTGV